MKKSKNSSHKIGRSAPKKRPTPAFDRAVAKLTTLREQAASLSPRNVRALLRKSRNASRKVWTRAVRAVFGKGVREIPDMRQLRFGGGR